MVHSSEPIRSQGFWYKLVHLEPAVIRGVVIAIVAVLASFGVLVSDELNNNLIIAITAVLALAQALWTRSATIPTEKVIAYVDDTSTGEELVAGPAAPPPMFTEQEVNDAVYRKAV